MKRYVHPPKPWYGKYLSYFLSICILSVVACKKGEDAEPTTDGTQAGKYPFPIVLDATCLLTKTESGTGIYSTFDYDTNKKLTAFYTHVPANGFIKELNSTYTLTRDTDGSVIKIQALGDNGIGAEIFIDYNASGSWIKTKINNKISPAYITITPEYNTEGNIVKITRENVDVNNPYTTINEYTYEKGNINIITNYINNKPVISKLEYDLTKEAKWSEFDLLNVYLGSSKPLHKNVLKKVVTPTSIEGSASVNDLTYQFNDKGYPVHVSSVSVFNGITSKPLTSTNTYRCD